MRTIIPVLLVYAYRCRWCGCCRRRHHHRRLFQANLNRFLSFWHICKLNNYTHTPSVSVVWVKIDFGYIHSHAHNVIRCAICHAPNVKLRSDALILRILITKLGAYACACTFKFAIGFALSWSTIDTRNIYINFYKSLSGVEVRQWDNTTTVRSQWIITPRLHWTKRKENTQQCAAQ